MPTDTKPTFPDQKALLSALYRIGGLVAAIEAISETNSDAQIAESALNGVQAALELETDNILHAVDIGEIVVICPAPVSDDAPLNAAIERHSAAVAAVDARRGPEDIPIPLIEAEDEVLHEIAALPCDDATLLVKLRYMLADQKRRYGPSWCSSEAGEIMTALDLHLNVRV